MPRPIYICIGNLGLCFCEGGSIGARLVPRIDLQRQRIHPPSLRFTRPGGPGKTLGSFLEEHKTPRSCLIGYLGFCITEGRSFGREMARWSRDLTISPLWDTLDGFSIAIDHEKKYRNADKNFRVRRILVFATHPQSLFYEPIQSENLENQAILRRWSCQNHQLPLSQKSAPSSTLSCSTLDVFTPTRFRENQLGAVEGQYLGCVSVRIKTH